MSAAVASVLNLDTLSIAETDALTAWGKYRTHAEPLGLDFGAKMNALRDALSARGKDGEGLCAWLNEKGIPRSTAYFWINRYEISIGVRGIDDFTSLVSDYQFQRLAKLKGVTGIHSSPEGLSVRCDGKTMTFTRRYDVNQWLNELRVPAEQRTEEELNRQEQRAGDENQMERLFEGCGFHLYVKQNCATNEDHFNVVFSALTKAQVNHLAQRLGKVAEIV